MTSMMIPALILIVGACFIPFLPKNIRNWIAVALPALAFYAISKLEVGTLLTVPFLHYDLILLRVDKLSKIFGYIFTLSSCVALIYGYYEKKISEHVTTLLYVGSALGVVFAGDLFTLYIFWELMAITSTFLILLRRTPKSMAAGIRYILVHVAGGLILLAGIIITVHQTGSILFSSFNSITLGTVLILIGILVNVAAVPLSSWLPDAYPEASIIGGVVLSAYTSKTAVYALLRGFSSWDILIWVGCAMAIYGIIYGLLENDMRRILAYSIVNQVGFMVCAVGIGTPLALAGATAHAFCSIIYTALLWMSAGAVLKQTGKRKITELGNLYNSMPWTSLFGVIGCLTISSFPLTSGFTSKTMIIAAAEYEHLFLVWLILKIGSVGVFLFTGLKYSYFVFFSKDKGLAPKEEPRSMLLGMGILSFLCIYLGCFPEVLYNILPHTDKIKEVMPVSFFQIYVEHWPHVITQSQLLLFSALAFFLFLSLLKQTNTLSLDFDWTYRKGGRLFYQLMDRGLNGLNTAADKVVIKGAVAKINQCCINAPAYMITCLLWPYWRSQGLSIKARKESMSQVFLTIEHNALPIGLTAMLVVVLLAGGILFC